MEDASYYATLSTLAQSAAALLGIGGVAFVERIRNFGDGADVTFKSLMPLLRDDKASQVRNTFTALKFAELPVLQGASLLEHEKDELHAWLNKDEVLKQYLAPSLCPEVRKKELVRGIYAAEALRLLRIFSHQMGRRMDARATLKRVIVALAAAMALPLVGLTLPATFLGAFLAGAPSVAAIGYALCQAYLVFAEIE